jgi:hypothetical protein
VNAIRIVFKMCAYHWQHDHKTRAFVQSQTLGANTAAMQFDKILNNAEAKA